MSTHRCPTCLSTGRAVRYKLVRGRKLDPCSDPWHGDYGKVDALRATIVDAVMARYRGDQWRQLPAEIRRACAALDAVMKESKP